MTSEDNRPCRLCQRERRKVFERALLRKYTVDYFICDHCGLLQTEDPYWLEEAYGDAISSTDTGILARNIRLSKLVSTCLYFVLGKDAVVLDAAGGYGLFARLMRDIGFACFWSDKYSYNVFAKGFEHLPGDSYQAATAFEVLEHVANPLEFLEQLLIEQDCSMLVFSTELFKEMPPKDWWYFADTSGQHVSFYQIRTLQFIADKLSMCLVSNGNLHAFYRGAAPLSLIKLLLGKFSYLLAPWVRFRMDSKTFADFRLMEAVRETDKRDA